MARLERRVRLLAQHMPDMIYRFEFRPEPRFDYVSPSSVALSGYTPEDHYANPDLILEVIHPEDRALVEEGLAEPRDGGEPMVLRWIHREGHVVYAEQQHRLERGPDGEVVAIEGVVRDVTERIERERALEHEAHHDPLTGLANTRMLEEVLRRHLSDAQREPCVVAVVQLDEFAVIRDLVGRGVSESLVQHAAGRLRELTPAGALVAKGADELFWLVYPQADRPAGDKLLRRIADSFREPLTGAGREVYLSVTAGARLVGPGEEVDIEGVLNDADNALRAARSGGLRATTRWFDPDLHRRATERLDLEHDLRDAVRDGDIGVVFQPQVDMTTGAVVGFEALARWDRPGHGPVPPGQFVALAERAGLIADLGDHVLFSAARQFARWRALGLVRDARVSVNVSRRQLGLPDLADSVLEIVQAAGLPPDGLTVEVTESGVMEAGWDAATQLGRLAAAGVRVSIDDFGTGYSSLSSLRELPVDELKIDRAFVAHMCDDRGDAAICAAVVALARGLGLEMVAEGVESDDQVRALLDLGCTVGQGYLFGRPQPAGEITRLLERAPTSRR